MNQKQRNYLSKELASIATAKCYDIDQEFINKRPTIPNIIEDIKSGKLKLITSHDQVGYNVVNIIPDETLVNLIKEDIATIEGRSVVITTGQYVDAIKAGWYMYDMDRFNDMNPSQIQNSANSFISNIRGFINVSSINTKTIHEIPECVSRKKTVWVEHKRLERKVMLGNDSEILDMLEEFQKAEF